MLFSFSPQNIFVSKKYCVCEKKIIWAPQKKGFKAAPRNRGERTNQKTHPFSEKLNKISISWLTVILCFFTNVISIFPTKYFLVKKILRVRKKIYMGSSEKRFQSRPGFWTKKTHLFSKKLIQVSNPPLTVIFYFFTNVIFIFPTKWCVCEKKFIWAPQKKGFKAAPRNRGERTNQKTYPFSA